MSRMATWRRPLAAVLAAVPLLFAAACSQSPATGAGSKAKAAPGPSAAYQAEAQRVLGSDGEVILSGDLAKNGHIQLLIVTRLPRMPKNVVPGLLVSRAAILEKDAGEWHEIFLADDYLKNTKGFLAGTPLASVNAWRLQYEQEPVGLEMFFTPIEQAPGSYHATVEVRWNPKTRRYQSLDREYKNFLSESPSLGPVPEFQMRQ